MRVLITGVSGFAGRHLARYLQTILPDIVIHGTALQPPGLAALPNVVYHVIDLRDDDAVHTLVADVHPDHVYHLAAQAFVPRSFEDPWETLENNIKAQINLITGCLRADIKPHLMVASSSEIYGLVQPDELPIREDAPLRPTSPYSVSKISQDMLGLQYHLSHNLPIIRVRPFNHIGPGQEERYVAPAFAMQIARIEAGLQEPIIKVGDLSPRRDYTDVRDMVRAYHLVLEKGTPGAVYNIASGRSYSIRYLLDQMLERTTSSIEVEVDPARLRPVTLPILEGDYTRLREATGWTPTIPFEQTLADILDDCRQRVHS